MKASKPRSEATSAERGDVEHIRSEASLKSETSRAEVGSDDVASREAKKEAFRNALRGDQFVVESDLEDSDQRDAAPGTREQD